MDKDKKMGTSKSGRGNQEENVPQDKNVKTPTPPSGADEGFVYYEE
jgi:hypothetical protein